MKDLCDPVETADSIYAQICKLIFSQYIFHLKFQFTINVKSFIFTSYDKTHTNLLVTSRLASKIAKFKSKHTNKHFIRTSTTMMSSFTLAIEWNKFKKWYTMIFTHIILDYLPHTFFLNIKLVI